MPIQTSADQLAVCHVGQFQGHAFEETEVAYQGLAIGYVHAHVNGLNGAKDASDSLTMSFNFGPNSGLPAGDRDRHYTYTSATGNWAWKEGGDAPNMNVNYVTRCENMSQARLGCITV